MLVSAHRAQRGLTLLELVVTLAILAILLTLAVPSMQAVIARNRLKAAAHAVAEDLQWTRSEAVKRHRRLAFVIDRAHWCYGIEVASAATCDCRLPAGASGACPLKRVSAADFPGTRLDATFTSTRFEPRRATAVNGSLTVTSRRGSSIRIILSRLGRVRFCSPSHDIPGYDSCHP